MKIIIFTNNLFQYGGVERVLTNLSNYWVRNKGYQVKIVSLFSDSEKEKKIFDLYNEVKIKSLGINIKPGKGIITRFENFFVQIKEINSEIKKENYDICISTHIFINNYCAITKLINSNKKLKYIASDHSTNLMQSKYRKMINTYLYKIMDKVVLLTNNDADFYRKYINNIEVIPNSRNYNNVGKADLKRKTILSIGRLSYVKGFDRLIRSFSLIAKEYEEWNVNIVGSGEEENNLRKLIKELNLERRISIIPFTKEVNEFYKTSSIYVLPSRDESFGMVLLEAMSFGIPCIAYKSFGPMDIINNNNNGILVDNGDINEFSNQIRRLIESYELRKELGKKSIERMKKYNIENIGEKWDRLFYELCNKN